MLRKLTLGLIAVASLSAITLAPSVASAHSGGGHSGGHSGGFAPHANSGTIVGSKAGTRFIGPAVHKEFHHRHFHRGFGVAYIGPGYLNDECYVTRRVATPFGPRLRTINVCAY
jgi:hypothetical protein